MKRLIAVILLLFGGVALADDCARQRTVYQSYQPTYYQQPYYPTYQYTPYQQYQNIVLVPKVVEVEVQRDHYYSIDSYYRDSLLADAIVGRLAKVQQAPTVQPEQPQQPAPVPQPVPQRQKATVDPNRASSYQNPKLLALFNSRCVKCHQAENRMPLVTPDGKALLDLPKIAALDVYFRVNTGNMPKTAPPVEDEYMPFLAEFTKACK